MPPDLDAVLAEPEFAPYARRRTEIEAALEPPAADDERVAGVRKRYDAIAQRHAEHLAERRRGILTRTVPITVVALALIAVGGAWAMNWTPLGWALALGFVAVSAVVVVVAGFRDGRTRRQYQASVVTRARREYDEVRHAALVEDVSRVVNRRLDPPPGPQHAPRLSPYGRLVLPVGSTVLTLDGAADLVERRAVGVPRVLVLLAYAVTGGSATALLAAVRAGVRAPSAMPGASVADVARVIAVDHLLATRTALLHPAPEHDEPADPVLTAVRAVATRFERDEIGPQDVLDGLSGVPARSPGEHSLLLLCRVVATVVVLAGSLRWDASATPAAAVPVAPPDAAATTDLADAGAVLLHTRIIALAAASAASREQWLRHVDPDPQVLATAERVRAEVGLR